MPRYRPLTHARDRHRRLRTDAGYRFAAMHTHARLAAHEMPLVLGSQPMAFVRRDDAYVPVAVQSLHADRNLYVGPDGHWVAGHVPDVYRMHPFALGRGEGEQLVLYVDDESELLSETEGELLFEPDGGHTPVLQAIVELLRRFAAQEQITAAACAALARHHLIVPWELRVQSGPEGRTEIVQGLYRIDEQALNALSDEAFLELRHASALPVAWCQMLSMNQISVLQALAVQRSRAPQAPGPDGSTTAASLDFLSSDTGIDLGRL